MYVYVAKSLLQRCIDNPHISAVVQASLSNERCTNPPLMHVIAWTYQYLEVLEITCSLTEIFRHCYAMTDLISQMKSSMYSNESSYIESPASRLYLAPAGSLDLLFCGEFQMIWIGKSHSFTKAFEKLQFWQSKQNESRWIAMIAFCMSPGCCLIFIHTK